VWLASALSVSSRLWLGGVVQVRRDGHLIRTLLLSVRSSCGAFQSVLLCTDGLSSYPKQALSRYCVSLFAAASEDGLGFFCRRGSWSPRRSRGTPADGWLGSFGASFSRHGGSKVGERLRATQGGATALINTAYTSSGCRPPFAPGLSRWCAKRARRCVRGRR
jgi:hypothetical protein